MGRKIMPNEKGVFDNESLSTGRSQPEPAAPAAEPEPSPVPLVQNVTVNQPEPRTAPADLPYGINIRSEASMDVVGSKIDVSITNLSGQPLQAVRITVDGRAVYPDAGAPAVLGSKFHLRRGQLGSGHDHELVIEAWGEDGSYASDRLLWQTA